MTLFPYAGPSMKHAALATAMIVLGSAPAFAQAIPSPTDQEVLIKTSLLTFNDANVTGNYSVFHDKLSKPFRDKFSADALKEGFKEFQQKHIDISDIAAKPVTPGGAEKIDEDGVLRLEGKIVVSDDVKVGYKLSYIRSDGEWKLLGLNVKLN